MRKSCMFVISGHDKIKLMIDCLEDITLEKMNRTIKHLTPFLIQNNSFEIGKPNENFPVAKLSPIILDKSSCKNVVIGKLVATFI